MAHSYTNEHEDPHPSRTHSESVQYPGHESNASEASAENAFYLRLAAGSWAAPNAGTLRERGSSKVRSAAMQQAQRLHGNRAVQRYIQHRKPQDTVPVQRQPWDDWPLGPRCPIAPIGPQIGCAPIGRGGTPEPAKQPPVPTPTPGKKGKRTRKAQTKGKKPKDSGSQGGF